VFNAPGHSAQKFKKLLIKKITVAYTTVKATLRSSKSGLCNLLEELNGVKRLDECCMLKTTSVKNSNDG